jgi:hypothetical protein
MSDDELRQADLSHLRIDQMTPEQKAEMRRRYDEFVRSIAGRAPKPSRSAAGTAPPNTTKWVPKKAR